MFSFWLDEARAIGYQLKDSLQFKCDVGVITHSPSMHLLRVQWTPWDSNWVDPLDPCNSDAEHDTDDEEAAAAYGPDDDDLYGMWWISYVWILVRSASSFHLIRRCVFPIKPT